MLKHTISRPTLSALLIALTMSISARAPVDAREIQINGLPCNDLCQAWLGYRVDQDSTGSMREGGSAAVRRSIRRRSTETSEQQTGKRRSMAEVDRVRRAKPVAEHPEPATRRTIVAKRVRPQVRTARKDVPQPVQRPPLLVEETTPAAKLARVPTPGPAQARPEREGNVAAPDAGPKKNALLNTPPSPEPTRSGMKDRLEPSKDPIQTAILTAPIAPPPPMEPPALVMPRVIAIPPASDTSRAPATPGIDAARSVSGEISDRQQDHTPAAQAARPSIVAALPPASDAGSILRNDNPIGSIQENPSQITSQPAPTSAAKALSVVIGQVSAEPSGTDVHVLVINASQVEVKDVDITCRASDVQGQKVAEASIHIGKVEPTDVALDRVLFRSGVATKDDGFTCAVDAIASLEGRMSVR